MPRERHRDIIIAEEVTVSVSSVSGGVGSSFGAVDKEKERSREVGNMRWVGPQI